MQGTGHCILTKNILYALGWAQDWFSEVIPWAIKGIIRIL